MGGFAVKYEDKGENLWAALCIMHMEAHVFALITMVILQTIIQEFFPSRKNEMQAVVVTKKSAPPRNYGET